MLFYLHPKTEPATQRERGVRVRDVRPRLPRQGDAGEAHELPRRGEATRVPRVRKEVRQGDLMD